MESKIQSTLHYKLTQIQYELKAPKSQYNSFGKYKYRSCEDILEGLKPLLLAHNCTLTLTDEPVQVAERIYIKATATIVNAENPAESVSNTAYAREDDQKKGMDGSQITGTASSYARKYALNGLFLIDDTKDADTDEYQNTTKEKTATPKQVERLAKFYTGDKLNKLLEYNHVAKIEDIPMTKASELISKLEKLEKGANNE